MRLTLIPNAKDYKQQNEYQVSMQETHDYFEFLGGTRFSTMDLRKHNSASSIMEALDGTDLLWVCGGNSFLLRYQMQRSGFDDALPGIMDSPIVYGGESAGAIVMGDSLKGIELCDDPRAAPEIIWEGLGVAGGMIVPHADNADFGPCIERISELYRPDQQIILNDNQALLVTTTSRVIVTAEATATIL